MKAEFEEQLFLFGIWGIGRLNDNMVNVIINCNIEYNTVVATNHIKANHNQCRRL
jgi:hypothetical protein